MFYGAYVKTYIERDIRELTQVADEVKFLRFMTAAFFESFVIAEIIKSYCNKGVLEPTLYFYRDKDMNEIDLLIENKGILYPLEMKKHADPQKKDIAAFDLLDKIPAVKRGPGGVICLYDNLVTLKDSDKVIPIKYI